MVDQNLQQLMHLLEKKQLFAAFHYFQTLPPNTPIPNKQRLVGELEAKLNTARSLTTNVNIILEKGDYPKALRQLQKAQILVPDFPNIQTDIDFITASIVNLDKNLKQATQLAARGKKQAVSEILDSVHKIDRRNGAIPVIEKLLRRTTRKKNAKSILMASLAIVIPFVYFGFEQITLIQSSELWQKADHLMAKKQYANAEAMIMQMENRLKFVHVFGQEDKVHLLTISSKRLNSEQFILGRQGITESGPIKKKTNGNERHVQSLLAQATIAEKENIDEAIKIYDSALKFSEGNKHLPLQLVSEIRSRKDKAKDILHQKNTQIALHEFNIMLNDANEFYTVNSWQHAIVSFQKALDYAKQQNINSGIEVERAALKLNTAFVRYNMEEGEVAFNQYRYAESLMHYQTCLDLLKKSRIDFPDAQAIIQAKVSEVEEIHFKVSFNEYVQRGDSFFLEQKYDLSINEYRNALKFLAKNSGSLVTDSKIVLTKKMVLKISEAEKRTIVISQREHLLASYKKILRNNFNLSRNTHFKKPEIRLIANKGDHLIFKVSAFGAKSESSSKIKYELDYKFNVKTGQWNINDIPLGV